MPYYLRFLKAPILEDYPSNKQSTARSKRPKQTTYGNINSGVKLRLIFTCQTDLGDTYYDEDALVTVYVTTSISSKTSIAQGLVHWRRGDMVRSDSVDLLWNRAPDLSQELWIILEAKSDQTLSNLRYASSNNATSLTSSKIQTDLPRIDEGLLLTEQMPEIVSVAAPMLIKDSGSNSGRHVLRQFAISMPTDQEDENLDNTKTKQEVKIHIYEELGESIARHIWDAALALIAACTENPTLESFKDNDTEQYPLPQLLEPYFHRTERKTKDVLTILELGSGCGIVGLSLARVIHDAQFILTDLPEAMEILELNASHMTELGLAPGTSITTGVLDWNWALNDAGRTDSATNGPMNLNLTDVSPDLVIVSDCTYNSSSFKALIATLLQVVRQHHRRNSLPQQLKLDILVSYKHRHESEFQFFEDMHNAGFRILACRTVIFPDRTRVSAGLNLEKAEIFAFALQEVIDTAGHNGL